jgi:hypothetical protein
VCKCEASFSACKKVWASDLVFIGTVESIEPIFLSRWSLTDRSSLQWLNDAYIDAQQRPSAGALDRLKDAYLQIVTGLAGRETEAGSRDDAPRKAQSKIRRQESKLYGMGICQGIPLGSKKMLAGPQPLHIDEKSCATQVLLLPKKYDD